MTLVDFLSAFADDVQNFEPDHLEPYTGEAYAAVEAQRHVEEVQQ